jgi:HPt (histidine-containing phosphotransfer) domain-containing protein
MASGGTGGTGLGANSFDIASLGVNATSLVKGGFGLNGLVGGGMSAIGGSGLLGSFGAGMSGGSAAASFIAAESATAGAGLAAGMGSAFAAAAGPLMIAAAATAGLKALAGDKRLGGGFGNVMNTIGDLPIIGDLMPVIPLVNALFGRGPLKQKGTTLSGSVGAEGFTSGSLQTDFVAKGGLFRSDKNDFARVDAVTGAVSTDNEKLQSFADQLAKSSKEIIGLINDTTTQVSTSLRMVGRDLGLSVDSIDSFSRSIELVSEKGKLLTDEQIASEISAITDELARGLIPEVDSLSKRGESAIQTVNRLGIEFNAIVDSAVVILDKTIAESKKLVQSISFEDRTEFVDAAGGVDALSQKVSFFAQNFLTEAERLAPAQEKVTEELSRLGLSSTLTRDQFRDLVQSYGQVNGITEDTLQALLNLAPAFVSVTKAAEDATETAKQQASVALNDAFSVLQKSVDAERQKITDNYNDALKAVNERIQSVSDSIGKLKTLSDALKSTVDALRPMSRQQAKDQIQQAIDAARSGKALPDAKDLQQALGVLGNKSTSGFASSFEFAREQAKTANLIGELGGLTDSQLTVEERSLDALEAQRDRLDQGFRDEIERLDTLLEQGKAQIDSINGLNTSVVSLIDALGQLNLRLLQGGGSGVIDPTTGGAPVGGTNKERGQLINQFINAPGRTPEEVYAASVKYDVTAEELDSQSKYTLKEINDWIDSKGLKRLSGVPGFALGGMHRGGLRIVGERGPELESTGPSRITSNNDLKNIVNNDGVVKAISELQAEISEVKTSNDKVRKILDSVTQGGTYLRVKNIV